MTGRRRMRSLLLAMVALSAPGLSVPGGAKNADEAVEQTAMAIPRIGMPGAHGVALPQPLSPADAARIRRIFAQQRAGSLIEARREMDHLESDLLRGVILADRYLGTGSIPETQELSAWLARFGDLSDAPAIRVLLQGLNQRPGEPESEASPANRATGRSKPAANAVPARISLVQNNDRAAIDSAMALLGTQPAGSQAADSLIAGGVAAWRTGKFNTARTLFEAAWQNAPTPTLRANAALWASRVAERAHDRGGRIQWLRRTAREGDTFYGPIARRALTPIAACLSSATPTRTVVSNADVEALMATAPGRRTFALLQVGERARAEAELRALWLDSGSQPALGRSLLLVAKAVDLNQFAEDLRRDSAAAEAALGKFELPMLRPSGGFRMDPAFVYAVVRHESNFQPLAVSSVGARGLMQVMPATAVHIGAIGQGQTDRLNDPSTNLAIGQSYLIQLSENALVKDDLLKVIAAYGQGPTGMNRWAENINHRGDPFVFLEAIPSPFMRQFVIDVLIFHWQYAAALRIQASSLDDMAAGIYPRFTPIKAASGGIKARQETCAMGASPKG